VGSVSGDVAGLSFLSLQKKVDVIVAQQFQHHEVTTFAACNKEKTTRVFK